MGAIVLAQEGGGVARRRLMGVALALAIAFSFRFNGATPQAGAQHPGAKRRRTSFVGSH